MPSRRAARSLCAVLILVTASACTRSSGSTASPASSAAGGFAAVDAAMRQRVDDDHLDGAALLVVQHGKEIHRATFGSYKGDEQVRIASASKWLTAALAMMLVDDGKLTLDDPITRWLPAFASGPDERAKKITLRHLLSHSSGIRDNECLYESSSTLEACANDIATTSLTNAPGTEFHYGNTSYQVAARLIEVASGQRFTDAFEQRVAKPLGMTKTRFDAATQTDNPIAAAGGESSLDDYGAFLALMLGQGELHGTRLLSEHSVDELLRNQEAGHENPDDFAVQITNTPQYGLGMWLDKIGGDGRTIVASGSGSLGFYPWIDRAHDAYGIVEVEDTGGSNGHAVRTSQAICKQAIAATPNT